MIVNQEITMIKNEISKIYDSLVTKNEQQDEALLMLVSLIEVLKDKSIITQADLDDKKNYLKSRMG
ncbi:hypothetical protein [Priestia megaterium]|uniref:hypothetical protein n=1 Tax=Priestia megaterium TaxID=1404 RepID=UPI000BA73E62|nr:hypothetical protein [Priestia megaterium]PAK47606.1 hypothetical protein CHH47_19360 [Priestia megaterium]